MQLGSARIGASSGSGFSQQLAGAAATLELVEGCLVVALAKCYDQAENEGMGGGGTWEA